MCKFDFATSSIRIRSAESFGENYTYYLCNNDDSFFKSATSVKFTSHNSFEF